MRNILATAFALVPAAALAHEGHHEQMPLAEAVRHLLSQPDHQMMFAALVVVVAAGGWMRLCRRAAK
jgi:hypothetical protein